MLKFHNNLLAFSNALYALYSDWHGYFQPVTVTSESSRSWLLYAVILSDVGTSWLATETSNMPHALKLTSAQNSDCRRLHQPAWVELRRTSSHRCNFPCDLWCKLDLKERATTNEIKHKAEEKQGRDGAPELLPWEFHATASLISTGFPTQL